jgi:hypothetical protein
MIIVGLGLIALALCGLWFILDEASFPSIF